MEPPSMDLAFRRSWMRDRKEQTWAANQWCGIWCLQSPIDLWVVQEIIAECRPDRIVECGSFMGGSALAWSMVLGQVHPEGRVLAIDHRDRFERARELPAAKRVRFLVGSTTSPQMVRRVEKRCAGRSTMVILDSDHTTANVAAELAAYAPLVTPGQYLIVQDTMADYGPDPLTDYAGPWRAVQEFLATEGDAWEVDETRERMVLTCAPGGFLRRR